MRRSIALLLTVALLSLLGPLVGCAGDQTELPEAATPQPAARELPFEGTVWQVASYNSGDGALTDSIDPAPTLRFMAGELTGTTGVNQFAGTYELGGTSLKITLGPSTLIAGTPEAMDQESAFLAALATVSTYSIDGEVLTLTSESGEAALVCSPAP